MKQGTGVKLTAHLVSAIARASLVEEVPGKAVAVSFPQLRGVHNVAVSRDDDEDLSKLGDAGLTGCCFPQAPVPLQVIRQQADQAIRFLKCTRENSVRDCAQ